MPYADWLAVSPAADVTLLAVDEALEQLAAVDARKARVVELRHFGGLSVDETAEVLQVSVPTVMRDWALAKAWLARALRHADESHEGGEVTAAQGTAVTMPVGRRGREARAAVAGPVAKRPSRAACRMVRTGWSSIR